MNYTQFELFFSELPENERKGLINELLIFARQNVQKDRFRKSSLRVLEDTYNGFIKQKSPIKNVAWVYFIEYPFFTNDFKKARDYFDTTCEKYAQTMQ